MSADETSEHDRIQHLAKLRRRYKAIFGAATGDVAAQDLTRLRGDFGDWCWLAWYSHQRGIYEQAAHAIERALEMRPGHEQSMALATQIRREWKAADERAQRQAKQKQQQAEREAIIHQDRLEHMRYRAAHPVTVPRDLRATSAEDSLLDGPCS